MDCKLKPVYLKDWVEMEEGWKMLCMAQMGVDARLDPEGCWVFKIPFSQGQCCMETLSYGFLFKCHWGKGTNSCENLGYNHLSLGFQR